MISVQKRFLFVHVPKTGGNSVQEVLGREQPGERGAEAAAAADD
jgi:hypothetical protein